MARGRTIKPEFFRDKLIGRLGATVGMVYQALWCWADDGGVCRIEPDVLKGECFMRWPEYTTGVLTDCLAALHGARRIVPYEVDGELYAELPNLAEHSPINHPSKFRYPRGGEAVTDIRAWLTGQYTPVALREPSAPISHLPLAITNSQTEHTAAGESDAVELHGLIPEAAHRAVAGFLRAAQDRAAVVASIRAVGPGGIHAVGVTWDVVGQALTEMAAAGARFSARTLRVFAKKIADDATAIDPPRRGENQSERNLRIIRETDKELERNGVA